MGTMAVVLVASRAFGVLPITWETPLTGKLNVRGIQLSPDGSAAIAFLNNFDEHCDRYVLVGPIRHHELEQDDPN